MASLPHHSGLLTFIAEPLPVMKPLASSYFGSGVPLSCVPLSSSR